MKRGFRFYLSERRGNVIVEFALIAPILLMMIVGLFELGRLYFVHSIMRYAADEAGRYAMVYPTASNSTITDQVTQHLTGVNPANVTVVVQGQTIGGNPYKQISLSYNFSSVAGGLIGLQNIPLSVQSTVPVLP